MRLGTMGFMKSLSRTVSIQSKSNADATTNSKTTVQRFVQLFMGYQTVDTMVFLEQLVVNDAAINCIKSNLPIGKPILEDYF